MPRPRSTEYALHLRWGVMRDLPAIIAIENASFTHAWTEDNFLTCLRQRNIIMMVAERGDEILGFVVYELHPAEVKLLNFAVRPDARRQGIGAALVAKMQDKLMSHRRERLTAMVRESNTAAQLFFRKHHFQAVLVAHRFYEDSQEDGYQFVYRPSKAEWANHGGEPVNRILTLGEKDSKDSL